MKIKAIITIIILMILIAAYTLKPKYSIAVNTSEPSAYEQSIKALAVNGDAESLSYSDEFDDSVYHAFMQDEIPVRFSEDNDFTEYIRLNKILVDGESYTFSEIKKSLSESASGNDAVSLDERNIDYVYVNDEDTDQMQLVIRIPVSVKGEDFRIALFICAEGQNLYIRAGYDEWLQDRS